jgi:hypothetical protein
VETLHKKAKRRSNISSMTSRDDGAAGHEPKDMIYFMFEIIIAVKLNLLFVNCLVNSVNEMSLSDLLH